MSDVRALLGRPWSRPVLVWAGSTAPCVVCSMASLCSLITPVARQWIALPSHRTGPRFRRIPTGLRAAFARIVDRLITRLGHCTCSRVAVAASAKLAVDAWELRCHFVANSVRPSPGSWGATSDHSALAVACPRAGCVRGRRGAAPAACAAGEVRDALRSLWAREGSGLVSFASALALAGVRPQEGASREGGGRCILLEGA